MRSRSRQPPPGDERPLVSVVVVSFNAADDVRDCLKSLRDQRREDVEILLVDNASSDGTPEMVRREFPEARLIETGENLGFCGGNNRGIRAARGRYVVLLNPDTLVEPGWLDGLVSAMEADPDLGAAQSKVVRHPDDQNLNTAGNGINYLFFGWSYGNGSEDCVEGDPYEVPSASGCAMILRKDLLDELGGFDERLFMYHDDLDLSIRIRLAGYRVACVPASVVRHKYASNLNAWKMRLLERNRLLLLLKFYSGRALLKLLPALLATELAILAVALRGGWFRAKWGAYREVWRACREVRGEGARWRARLGYDDRTLVAILGDDMEADGVVSPIATRVFARFLRMYRYIVRLGPASALRGVPWENATPDDLAAKPGSRGRTRILKAFSKQVRT